MMSSRMRSFTGLMAPTFTPFTPEGEINLLAIEPYAGLLISKGISAVLINGTVSEGMSMSVVERKKVTEKWAEVCKKLDMILMVQISGCPLVDAIDLAKHAESLEVDGVLCLPELYFKPKTVEQLVQYLKKISEFCPNTRLYYYHIPMFTQVDLPMAQFMELAKKEIPSFAGIEFAFGDLEKGVACLKHGQVFLGSDTVLAGAISLGFNSAIMTSLNICPEISLEIIRLLGLGKVEEARKKQMELNSFVEDVLKKGNGEWISSAKKAFTEEFKHLNLSLGGTREPL